MKMFILRRFLQLLIGIAIVYNFHGVFFGFHFDFIPDSFSINTGLFFFYITLISFTCATIGVLTFIIYSISKKHKINKESPIALIYLILPGLFFWFIIQYDTIPWVMGRLFLYSLFNMLILSPILIIVFKYKILSIFSKRSQLVLDYLESDSNLKERTGKVRKTSLSSNIHSNSPQNNCIIKAYIEGKKDSVSAEIKLVRDENNDWSIDSVHYD